MNSNSSNVKVNTREVISFLNYSDKDRLKELLLSFHFLKAHFFSHTIQTVIQDLSLCDGVDLSIIRKCLEMGRHILEQAPNQFASQIYGRLQSVNPKSEKLQKFFNKISHDAGWLRPESAITSPETPLLKTILSGWKELSVSKGAEIQLSSSNTPTNFFVLPDGKVLIGEKRNGCLKIIDIDSSVTEETIEIKRNFCFTDICLLPNTFTLFVSLQELDYSSTDEKPCKLVAYDIKRKKIESTFPLSKEFIVTIRYLENSKAILVCTKNKMLYFDLLSYSLKDTLVLTREKEIIVFNDIFPLIDENSFLAINENFICKWHENEKKAIYQITGASIIPSEEFGDTFRWDLRTIVVSEQKKIILCSNGWELKTIDLETGKEINCHKGFVGDPVWVSKTDSSSLLVKNTKLIVWDYEKLKEVQTFQGHSEFLETLLIEDKNIFLSIHSDGNIRIWDF